MNFQTKTASVLMLLLLFAFNSPQQNTFKCKLTEVATGLTSPVAFAVANDGSNKLYIAEQRGKIKIIDNGKVFDKPFIDVSSKLDGLNIAYSEKGLLGIAFHPAYKTNKRFFIYYSAPPPDKSMDHQSIIAEYRANDDGLTANLTSEQIIMRINQPESNHNGGQLAFGKDGMLYIGTGDGGGAGDKHGTTGNSQDVTNLLGKILRIDVSSPGSYSVPADNPFVGKSASPEIWAYGLRNPWKFSFDRVTGTLFCADVGQNKYEEVNIIEKGKNYGWRIMEGNHCFNPPQDCNRTGLTSPIDEYDHSEGISVIGGYMYRGKSFPSLHGYYFFGDWNGALFALKKNQNNTWQRYNVLTGSSTKNDIGSKINSFGQDENGEIYLVTQNLFGPKSPTGTIYRLSL